MNSGKPSLWTGFATGRGVKKTRFADSGWMPSAQQRLECITAALVLRLAVFLSRGRSRSAAWSLFRSTVFPRVNTEVPHLVQTLCSTPGAYFCLYLLRRQ
jgi:hypothetical protein